MTNLLIRESTKARGLFLACLTILSPSAFAAAFATTEQSITYLGNAVAGTSSAVQDASTSYYNPAGLKYLCKNQVVFSGAYNYRHVKLNGTSATDSAGDVITGTNPSKPSADTFTPGFNGSLQLSNKVAVGLSVVEIFDTDIKYEGNSIARYMGSTTKISTIDISPSIGIKFDPTFYAGMALDFVRINMNMSSSVAWGNIGSEAFGYVNNTMHDWTMGFHLGILYVPTKCTRMGLVYFSSFTPTMSGTTASAQTLDFGNPTTVNGDFNLPDRINYSITSAITPKFTAMGEIEWTHWSKLKTFTLNYNSTARPGKVIFDFKNTVRLAMGGDYNFTPAFALKAGVSYDQSPVNDSHISIRVPENNRYIAAFGLSYKVAKWFSIVGAYSHAFMSSYSISETAATESLNSSPNVADVKTLNGRFNVSDDIFGLQLVFTFK